MWNENKPLKCERVGIRVTEETACRIKLLAKNRKVSRTKLIEKLVDDAWIEQNSMDGFFTREGPRYPD